MALQAHSFAPPPVYSHGDVAIGHPVLPQATEPPAPGRSQLVTDDRRIVQQKMKGSSVIVCCPQCGHTGPARVTKVSSSISSCSLLLMLSSKACIRQVYCASLVMCWAVPAGAAHLPSAPSPIAFVKIF